MVKREGITLFSFLKYSNLTPGGDKMAEGRYEYTAGCFLRNTKQTRKAFLNQRPVQSPVSTDTSVRQKREWWM